MRRWVCIVALLAGFSGQGYAWTIRPRIPAPIERPFEPRRGRARGPGGTGVPDSAPGHAVRPTADWWRRP